jgi:hypothetical protein
MAHARGARSAGPTSRRRRTGALASGGGGWSADSGGPPQRHRTAPCLQACRDCHVIQRERPSRFRACPHPQPPGSGPQQPLSGRPGASEADADPYGGRPTRGSTQLLANPLTDRVAIRAGYAPPLGIAMELPGKACTWRWAGHASGHSQGGSGRRGLGQDLQAQVQALVADPSVLAELAVRRGRQPAGDQEHSLPPVLTAEAAPGLRPLHLQP